MRHTIIRLGWLCGLTAAVCSRVVAAPAAVPAEAAALPAPGRGDLLGTLIDSSNAAQYKNIIVPELYPEVRAGEMAMDAVRSLHYEWRMDPDWQSRSAAADKLLDGRGGALAPGVRLGRGWLFGNRQDLSRETDRRSAAQRVLWNVHANFWSQKVIDVLFLLRIVAENKEVRALRGTLRRIYPSSLIPNDRTGQLFREIFRVDAPALLKDYAWLTFRFLGAKEDLVYVHSPAVGKTRQLTGSNRSDALAGSLISAEDLFVWSGRPDAVEPELTRKLWALTPFNSAAAGAAGPSGDFCVLLQDTVEEGQPAAPVKWNMESGRFVQAAPWVPTEVVYAPRELWRLELVAGDPFSLYGRQVLYVDAESMLPVYKFVYDQAGIPWKIVIGAVGLAESRDRKRYPYIALQVVQDLKAKQTAMLEYSNVRYCSQFPAGIELTEFQPGKLTRTPEKEKKQAAKPAPSPTPPPPSGPEDLLPED